ncbi:MAG: ATPase domain-containing protein [Candidatus Diapherotrites archaeon]
MADEEKKKALAEATERLLKDLKDEGEVLSNLKDIGVGEEEAKKMIDDAKKKGITAEKSAEQEWGGLGKGLPAKKLLEKEDMFWSKPLFQKKTKAPAMDEKSGKKGEKHIFGGMKFGGKKGEKLDEVLPEKKEKARHEAKGISSRSSGGGGGGGGIEREREKARFREVMPVRVSDFDRLIEKGGLKRGDTVLLSGGCGTGKTTFAMQSMYNAVLAGEKAVYLTLEETAEKIKENMYENFGWDLYTLEEENKIAIIKIDPLSIARAVEAALTKERGGLYIELEEFDLPFQFNLPFKPDRVTVDSLSALSIAFMENEQGYRQYLRHLFETLEKYNSVNIVLGETEQQPNVYSRSGVEEFLADGVIVLYNIKIHNLREKALEILKLRSSNHEKRIVPYKICDRGIEIYINQSLFRE